MKWKATRTLKVGHGHVHADEAYPEEPTPALLTLGWVVEGEGTPPADPLANVTDPDEAATIRGKLEAAGIGLTTSGTVATGDAPAPPTKKSAKPRSRKKK